MVDMMQFPNTVEEFMEQYKIVDTEQVYTNGAELVPIFRMEQWFDHIKGILSTSKGDDTIYRQAVIDALTHFTNLSWDELKIIYPMLTVIEELPAAQSERPKGKWIPHIEKSREYIGTVSVGVEYDYWLCDTCGYQVENGQPMYNFCPNCGTKMDEVE